MALDHYVPQVHLKNFYSPKLKVLMHAIRKKDLRSFTPSAQSVCRIENGSTNPYLQESRAVEEFLKGIEPRYNKILRKLATRDVDSECVYVAAGFVAYVLTCSPAGMRIQSEPLGASIEQVARVLDSKGFLPQPPHELGGKSLTENLGSGKVRFSVDPKYSQAIGVASMLAHISAFGNFWWDVLINPFEDSPFFTSDFPVAIEPTDNPLMVNRVVPLSPDLALRIRPRSIPPRHDTDLSFSGFRYAVRKISRAEAVSINRLIVRCAEDLVFFREDYSWIPEFVKRNAQFRIETKTYRTPCKNGALLWHKCEVVRTSSS